jgi:hypothetical protein
MVFVLSACITSPVSWAESQQQEIELESESKPDSPDDDKLITGFIPAQIASGFRLASSTSLTERRLPIIGTDAYPAIILHGPPAPAYPV